MRKMRAARRDANIFVLGRGSLFAYTLGPVHGFIKVAGMGNARCDGGAWKCIEDCKLSSSVVSPISASVVDPPVLSPLSSHAP